MRTILVVEHFRFGREYLARAKKLGYTTILASSKSIDVIEEKHKKNIDYFFRVSRVGDKGIAREIIEFYQKVKFDGVIAGHVGLVPLVSLIADNLDLPSFGYEAAIQCSYKNLGRKKMKLEGLFPYDFHEINSIEDIIALKNQLTYPMIIKPIDGFSSINVKKIHNFEELIDGYKNHEENTTYSPLGKNFCKTALLESYLEGKEYSVESIVQNGRVRVIAITDKRKNLNNPYVEYGHIVPAITLNEAQKSLIIGFVEQAHNVLNIGYGMTHTEIIIKDNNIGLIEINPRLAGGYIADAVGKAFDIDCYEIAVKNALGIKVEIPIKAKCCAYIGFVVADKKGMIGEIKGIEELKRVSYVEWVKRCIFVGREVKSIEDNRCRVCAYMGSVSEGDLMVFESMNLLDSMISLSIV